MIRGDDGSLRLSQPGLISKTITAAGLDEDLSIRTYDTPMREDFSDEFQDDSPPCDPTKYRSLLGMLIFLLRSRPDIAYAVNRLATRSIGATEHDLFAIIRIVKYLRSTSELELIYSAQDTHCSPTSIGQLFAWADASYLTHRDSKSHSSICFSYGSTAPTGMFHSQSKKQSTVATSSTHGEVNSAFEATKEIVYFRAILAELGFTQIHPTILYVDNASLITLATKFSGNVKAVKHYMMRINYMIEQVAAASISITKVHTTFNTADIGTKPLAPTPFISHRNKLLGPQHKACP
jgi:hypothetical protein